MHPAASAATPSAYPLGDDAGLRSVRLSLGPQQSPFEVVAVGPEFVEESGHDADVGSDDRCGEVGGGDSSLTAFSGDQEGPFQCEFC